MRTMTVREVSEYLRVHPTTVYRLVKTGRLPGFKVGDRWRFQQAEIDSWLRQGGGPPPDRSSSGSDGNFS